MKTKKTHVNNFGKFCPQCAADTEGFITYHDSDRYSEASEEQLVIYGESGSPLVRRAVAVERACRDLAEWQQNHA